MTTNEAYDLGYEAGFSDDLPDNPYEETVEANKFKDWACGYLVGQKEHEDCCDE